MSYYANTLFPTVEAVFMSNPDPLPLDPAVAAEVIRAAGYPSEADFVSNLSKDDLVSVYEWAGLVAKATPEDEAWAMAEQEWG